MSFPRYPEYRECGDKFLGKIPIHWTARRIRSITSFQKGKLPKNTHEEPTTESDLPYLTMEYLRGGEETIASMFIPIEDQHITANQDDILVLWDGSNAGEFLKAKKGVVSSTLAIIKNLSIDKNYLFYGLKSIEQYLKDQTIGMGIPHVSNDVLRNLIIYLPSDSEQTQITTFLDHQTIKIDQLISEQERLIGLLKEKRQAVISHAVTKGLAPKVKMKYSGIKWLGEVPDHWSCSILRRSVKEHKQGFYSTDDYVEEGVKLLRITDLNGDGTITYENCPLVNNCSELNDFLLIEGDFVFARTGGAGTFGKIGKIKENIAFASYLIRFRFTADLLPDFLNYYFQSELFIKGVESNIHGGVNKNIHAEDIKNQFIVYPSLDEQKKIANYLETLTKKYSELMDEAIHVISILKERRSALISAAVTGQIDVRNYKYKEVA